MKITGLDQQEYNWVLTPADRNDIHKSGPHLTARNLLKEIFPFDLILEELTLPGTKTVIRKSYLYADFFIPNRLLMIEVHGEQHYEYIPHFHKEKKFFYKARMRDKEKIYWCDINDISLVILKWDEEDNWKRLINDR